MNEIILRGGRQVMGFGGPPIGRPIVMRQRSTGLGFGLGDLPGNLGNIYNGLDPSGSGIDPSQLANQLQQDCSLCSSPLIQNAINAYQTIGPAASSTISDFASKNYVGGIQASLPLIGMAVTAMTGDPAAGAIVVGVLDIAEGVLQSLGLFNTTPPQVVNCNYVIFPIVPSTYVPPGQKTPLQTGVCIQNSTYTPTPVLINDPNNPATSQVTNPNWITLEQFMSGGSAQLTSTNTVSWQSIDASFNPEPDPTVGYPYINYPGTTWADIAFYPWFGGSGPNAGVTLANGFTFPQGSTYTLRGSLEAAGVTLPLYPGDTSTAPAFNPNNTSPLVDPTAFQNMLQGIGGSSDAGSAAQLVTNIVGFISGYCQIFLRAVCERAINNHTPVDPVTLLLACAQAWNAQYTSAAQYTFDISAPGQTFVDAVMQGNVPLPPNGFGQSPQGVAAGASVVINVGPAVAGGGGGGGGGSGGGSPIIKIPPGGGIKIGTPTPTPVSSGMSTGTKIALTTVAVGAVAAGSLYAYASYEGVTMKQAARKLLT